MDRDVVTLLLIKYLRKILVKISKIRQHVLNKLNFRLIFAVVTPVSENIYIQRTVTREGQERDREIRNKSEKYFIFFT